MIKWELKAKYEYFVIFLLIQARQTCYNEQNNKAHLNVGSIQWAYLAPTNATPAIISTIIFIFNRIISYSILFVNKLPKEPEAFKQRRRLFFYWKNNYLGDEKHDNEESFRNNQNGEELEEPPDGDYI